MCLARRGGYGVPAAHWIPVYENVVLDPGIHSERHKLAKSNVDGAVEETLGGIIEHAETAEPFLNSRNPKAAEHIEGRYG